MTRTAIIVSVFSGAVVLAAIMIWWPQTRSVSELEPGLKSGRWEDRQRAVAELGPSDDPRAEGLLVAALKDTDDRVRAAAARSLRNRDWRPRNVAEEAWFLVANDEWDRAAALGAAAVEPLAASVADHRPYGRLRALRALAAIADPQAAETLAAFLTDRNPDVRRSSAEALEKAGWTPKDAAQKAWQLVALGKWDEAAQLGAAAVAPLTAALGDEDASVREAAAKALEKCKAPGAARP